MESINQFVSTISEYIALVDSMNKHTKYEFLKDCARILPQIYTQALALPEPKEIVEKEVTVNKDQIKSVWEDIHSFLGEDDLYHEVFDPLADKDSIITHISYDLSDIYHDLKEGLIKYELGTQDSFYDALWDWKWSFNNHFGRHLVSVLRPIHQLLTDKLNENVNCEPTS